MPEETEVLYAVHAQGPDELYAAASKEEADTMASTQNELVPMAKCTVITSPWTPVEHWKTWPNRTLRMPSNFAGAGKRI